MTDHAPAPANSDTRATLFVHPFSSYCWKALIAFYEREAPFARRLLDPSDPTAFQEMAALWPAAKFPLLVDGDQVIPEASIIIEHMDRRHPGPPPMVPTDPEAALEARLMDRIFDLHVQTPMQRIVGDAMLPEGERQASAVADARARLERIYGWLETRMTGREWATGRFGLADCAAAPALFYADWIHPIPEALGALRAFRARLLARPSVARVVDEARPYRALFPLGAPDRD